MRENAKRVLRHLRSSKTTRIMEKKNSWFLHYDIAPAHILLVLLDHFAKNPCDFRLLPKLKTPIRGRVSSRLGGL